MCVRALDHLSCGGSVVGTTLNRHSNHEGGGGAGEQAGDAIMEFYAPTTGFVTFDSCASDFDTWLYVYADEALTELVCDCGNVYLFVLPV